MTLMGDGSFGPILLLGAAALALWIDVRFSRLRPDGLRDATVRLGSALLLLLLLPVAVTPFAGDGSPGAVRLGAVFALVLPALVYAVLVGVWIVKAAQGAIAGLR